LTDNSWYYVAVTRSETSVKAYLNGVQEGSTGTSSANISNANNLYIGRGPSGEAGITNGGQIDELRISNTARSVGDK
ncbi:MAG: LamG-like jellyroll fold domain-containing protein, partial [Pseudobdellovibrio sp.]